MLVDAEKRTDEEANIGHGPLREHGFYRYLWLPAKIRLFAWLPMIDGERSDPGILPVNPLQPFIPDTGQKPPGSPVISPRILLFASSLPPRNLLFGSSGPEEAKRTQRGGKEVEERI